MNVPSILIPVYWPIAGVCLVNFVHDIDMLYMSHDHMSLLCIPL